MSNFKDYTKVIIIALLTALTTQLLARVFIKNDLINNAATKTELNEAKKESFSYTDKKIVEYDVSHTKLHSEQKIQLTQIQSDLTLIKNHLINKP